MESEKEEILSTRLEPENAIDKFALTVKKVGQIVGHLRKSKSGLFTKTIFYFIRPNRGSACQVEVRGKRVNLGDAKRTASTMYSLVFSRREALRNILKSLPC